MKIPLTASKYIKQHRTEYINFSDDEAVALYDIQIKKEFEELKQFLPKRAETILDIGCGLAVMDIYLMKKYPNAKLVLLDGDGTRDDIGGFHREYTPYNSRDMVEIILKDNGVTNFSWLNVGHKLKLQADLTISLFAWGYHFPLDTYSVVSPNVICDVRIGHEPLNHFYSVIREVDNYKRIFISDYS